MFQKRAHVSTYHAYLHGCLLTWSRVNVPSVLTCSHANVSCVLTAPVPTCPALLRAHMSTCLACLRAHVPTCYECIPASLIIMPCLLTYSRVNVLCELMCSRSNMPWALYLTSLGWHSDLPTCLASLVNSFDASFFSFTAIAVEVARTADKVWQFN